MKHILFITLLFITALSHAQSEQSSVSQIKVEWKSSSFIDRISNDRVTAQNTFIIDKDQTIEWKQADEDARQVFVVKSLDGNWEKLDKDGYLRYVFDCHNTEGFLTAQRQNGVLSIILEIPGLRIGALSLLFEIDQATY